MRCGFARTRKCVLRESHWLQLLSSQRLLASNAVLHVPLLCASPALRFLPFRLQFWRPLAAASCSALRQFSTRWLRQLGCSPAWPAGLAFQVSNRDPNSWKQRETRFLVLYPPCAFQKFLDIPAHHASRCPGSLPSPVSLQPGKCF